MRAKLVKYFLAAAFLFFISATAVYATDCSLHGVPQNGYPNYQERGMLTITNAVRISPIPFRNYYLPTVTNILNSYPATTPLQWNYDLNRAARAWATDHASTIGCPFGHNSCSGSLWTARILSFYTSPVTQSLGIGENVAAGDGDPTSNIVALLLDFYSSSIPADNSGFDGHRFNIMQSGWFEAGPGFASGPNINTRYWAEDFAHPITAPQICSPIASAAHFTIYTDYTTSTANTSFLAPYYSETNQAPQTANVIIDGITHPMSLQFGSAARGTYRYIAPHGTSCRSYHFEFTDAAGAPIRYPVSGEFRTYGEGGCTENYVAAMPPLCSADFDHSGLVTVQDIFTFLQAWFSQNISADFDHSGSVSVQDIFSFLRAWFIGC